jgi:hypothetical protein
MAKILHDLDILEVTEGSWIAWWGLWRVGGACFESLKREMLLPTKKEPRSRWPGLLVF